MMVPPLPKSMTIYMNHIPEYYDRTKDKPFTPPSKPEPIVITNVVRDTVYVNKVQKDEVVITMPVVYFDTAMYNVRPEFETELQNFITTMKRRQEYKIDIYGFADKRNNDEYNRTLSLNRANSQWHQRKSFDCLWSGHIQDHRCPGYGSRSAGQPESNIYLAKVALPEATE
jgi:hypothetical protein